MWEERGLYRRDYSLCFPHCATFHCWPFGFLPLGGSFNTVFIISCACTFGALLIFAGHSTFLYTLRALCGQYPHPLGDLSLTTGDAGCQVGWTCQGVHIPGNSLQTNDRWELVVESSTFPILWVGQISGVLSATSPSFTVVMSPSPPRQQRSHKCVLDWLPSPPRQCFPTHAG